MNLVAQNTQTLKWTLTDNAGAAVDDATVTATLYSGRVISDPEHSPGTPVTGLTGLSLVHSTGGVYSGTVTGAFSPPYGANYVLVVDTTRPSGAVGHWEIPVVVIPRQE